jgi:hypothetical protein
MLTIRLPGRAGRLRFANHDLPARQRIDRKFFALRGPVSTL